MPTNSMLIIRPDYELATRYGAAWLTHVVNAASGIPVIDLYGPEATAPNFFSNLETQDPLLVNIFGHGNYNIINCQNNELLLQGGSNDEVLAERVIYNLSCRAGRDLGTSAVNNGAISFLGYDEDFIFIVSAGEHPDGGKIDPLKDVAAKGFFESHNIAPISYIQGGSLADSYYNSQDTFTHWIDIWEEIDSQVASLLVWDKDHQVIKPMVEPPKPPSPGGLFPLLLLGSLLFIPIIKFK